MKLLWLPCRHQDFHFSLSDNAACSLPPHPQQPLDSVETPKLSVAVYPSSGGPGEIAAHVSIAISDLTLTVREENFD